MINEFVYNIMYNTRNTLRKQAVDNEYFKQSQIVIVSDEHEVAYHAAGAFCMLHADLEECNVHMVLNGKPGRPDLLKQWQKEWEGLHVWESLEAYFAGKTSEAPEFFMVFANLRSDKYLSMAAREEKNRELARLLTYNTEKQDCFLQIVTCIPEITEALPSVTCAIAEREYEVIFRDKPADSLEKYVSEIENLVRSYPEQLSRVQVIRLDRVFGPGITVDDGAGVINILKSLKETKHVALHDKDRSDFFSAVYVRDAVVGILMAAGNGRRGNIYHVSSWEVSRFEIISNLYGAFPEYEMYIDTFHDGTPDDKTVSYRMLNAKKLGLVRRNNIAKVLMTAKKTSLKNTALWYYGESAYIPKTNINVYFGRMDRIREIELEILKEVDAVCKANGINYFLSAGTMLGAVRHGGFIPWDDDLDLGILPEDYEKLLKVLPDSLSVEYGYQTIGLDPNSHYIHDKIRLKNSFFSTKYSDRYEMYNGVYIDVFIYYKTSDHPLMQKLHIKEAALWRKIIGVCWADRLPLKRKSWRYKLVFKISRHVPASWADKIYRKICMKYEKRNTHYRIDGGFNLEKVGAIPDEWLHGTVDRSFEGTPYPILAHYDDFLRHWYGDHYMELLPLDGRKSVHDVIRIDLGQNLFEETAQDPAFRKVDIRGELFETK